MPSTNASNDWLFRDRRRVVFRYWWQYQLQTLIPVLLSKPQCRFLACRNDKAAFLKLEPSARHYRQFYRWFDFRRRASITLHFDILWSAATLPSQQQWLPSPTRHALPLIQMTAPTSTYRYHLLYFKMKYISPPPAAGCHNRKYTFVIFV